MTKICKTGFLVTFLNLIFPWLIFFSPLSRLLIVKLHKIWSMKKTIFASPIYSYRHENMCGARAHNVNASFLRCFNRSKSIAANSRAKAPRAEATNTE